MTDSVCPPHVKLDLSRSQIRAGRAISRQCANILERCRKREALDRKQKRAARLKAEKATKRDVQ